ncbi:MAG: tRNA 2-thiocytidine(32) synthetase TtcA [Deltaproteobacteria bacterium]|nr:tRNA 2-thiocytidine(32) synthetase TtcA [Deltaproteobacteria bacterium]
MLTDARRPTKSYVYKAINRTLGKALHSYDMITDGDRIVVGLSGGKDSMTLMWFLKERLARVPVAYELYPVYVDPGFEGGCAEGLRRFAREQDLDLRVAYTDYGLVAHSSKNRENPCFLCSRLRRKRLFEIADELHCSKLALGHHKDDIIETLLMNMCYAGEISTMQPSQSFFQGRFRIIRPLAYTDEDSISRFARSMNFPEFVNPCPSSERSRRREVKMMLKKLYRSNKKIRGNLFRSMSHVRDDYLLK